VPYEGIPSNRDLRDRDSPHEQPPATLPARSAANTTHETTGEEPRLQEGGSAWEDESGEELGPGFTGWRAFWDEMNSRWLYVNQRTGESSWEPPRSETQGLRDDEALSTDLESQVCQPHVQVTDLWMLTTRPAIR
jgi:hypothetical protein